ncbi:MAG: hypothetical protein WC111_07805, partial [Candidatus Cloacimonadaceae bacterium]
MDNNRQLDNTPDSYQDDISDSKTNSTKQTLHNGLSPVGTIFQIANQTIHNALSPVGTAFQIANQTLHNALSPVGT